MTEIPKPDGAIPVGAGNTSYGRSEILLGVNHDKTVSKLTPYIDFDGIQVHPSRVNTSNTLRLNIEVGKK